MSAREVAQSVPVSPPDDLYFIKSEGGPVKIGRGLNPVKRLSHCQIGSHERLELIGTLRGRGYEEKVWHAAFQDTRLRGEWYEHDRPLARAIEFALEGKDWWHHLWPPTDFEFSDDEEEWDDDVVDWHIAIQMAVVAARMGDKPPLKDANKLSAFAQCMVVDFISAAAERSYSPPKES